MLPSIIDQPTSVGCLPGRGVPDAVELITKAIAGGAKWYVRSDLKDFFSHIPKPQIRKFLNKNISDSAFVSLFMRALETELANEDAVREDLDLFPLGDEGVPQGSALSALCANITDPPKHPNNPSKLSYADMMFAVVFKVYSTVSGRRFMTDLNDAKDKGYIARVCHFNSIACTIPDNP